MLEFSGVNFLSLTFRTGSAYLPSAFDFFFGISTRFVFPTFTFLVILELLVLTTPFFQDRVGSEVYVNACYLTLPNLGGVGRADDIAG